MKTDNTIDPQSTNRNEDKNQANPTTTGSTHLNQQTTRTPETPQPPQTPQKEERETWKHPDPTAPEKRQEVYAGDKKDRIGDNLQDEDSDDEGLTDEDVDPRAEGKTPDSRSRENDDIDRGRNDEINP